MARRRIGLCLPTIIRAFITAAMLASLRCGALRPLNTVPAAERWAVALMLGWLAIGMPAVAVGQEAVTEGAGEESEDGVAGNEDGEAKAVQSANVPAGWGELQWQVEGLATARDGLLVLGDGTRLQVTAVGWQADGDGPEQAGDKLVLTTDWGEAEVPLEAVALVRGAPGLTGHRVEVQLWNLTTLHGTPAPGRLLLRGQDGLQLAVRPGEIELWAAPLPAGLAWLERSTMASIVGVEEGADPVPAESLAVQLADGQVLVLDGKSMAGLTVGFASRYGVLEPELSEVRGFQGLVGLASGGRLGMKSGAQLMALPVDHTLELTVWPLSAPVALQVREIRKILRRGEPARDPAAERQREDRSAGWWQLLLAEDELLIGRWVGGELEWVDLDHGSGETMVLTPDMAVGIVSEPVPSGAEPAGVVLQLRQPGVVDAGMRRGSLAAGSVVLETAHGQLEVPAGVIRQLWPRDRIERSSGAATDPDPANGEGETGLEGDDPESPEATES